MIRKLCILLVLIVNSGFLLFAQENHGMYLVHRLPQSNLLNPAVQQACKWYVGLPVLSSIHLNYANSAFSYKQLLETQPSGIQQLAVDGVIDKMHYRNYVGTELHVQLFSLGYKMHNNNFIFSITEKNNIPLTYPKEAAQLFWNGNSMFEGEKAGLKGTGLYFSHYREYALSASHKNIIGIIYGARAKLLFGKLNISTKSTDIGVRTDDTTFDLEFEGDMLINTSLPIVASASNNQLDELHFDNNADLMALAFNGKNPGFAIDAGIIYPYSEKLSLSASILDLGFIRWRSNLNTFDGSGAFTYRGFEGTLTPGNNFFDNLLDTLMQSMNFEVYPDKYTTFLPPKILAGADYKVNQYVSTGVVANTTIHKSKLMSALTFTAQGYATKGIQALVSYTIKNYSFNQLGAGLVLGRNPVQFYVLSDNILGFTNPLNARAVNLRFGLNLNLGCKKKGKKEKTGLKTMIPGDCSSLERQLRKNYKNKHRK